MQEDLNIERKVKHMVLSRLNKKPTLKQAAQSLGICERTLARYKWRYNIVFNSQMEKYVVKDDGSGMN